MLQSLPEKQFPTRDFRFQGSREGRKFHVPLAIGKESLSRIHFESVQIARERMDFPSRTLRHHEAEVEKFSQGRAYHVRFLFSVAVFRIRESIPQVSPIGHGNVFFYNPRTMGKD
jgi:hypothetical protein